MMRKGLREFNMIELGGSMNVMNALHTFIVYRIDSFHIIREKPCTFITAQCLSYSRKRRPSGN